MPGFVPRSYNDALSTREEGKEQSRGFEGPTVGGVGLGTKMTAMRWKRQSTGNTNSVPPRFVQDIQQNPGHHETWMQLFLGKTADGAAFAGLPEDMPPPGAGAPPPAPESKKEAA